MNRVTSSWRVDQKPNIFMWLLFGALLSVALVMFSPSPRGEALTTVPTLMNFQGRLTDSSGNIRPNGTYNMKLRLYDAASGGTLKWSEDRLVSASQGVSLVNGLFSIKLGQVTPLPANIFASGSLYLEVELATPATATSSSPVWTEGAMTPRNQLATSAYAYNAETLDGLDSSAFAAASGSSSYIQNTTSPQTGNFNITGMGTIGGSLSVGATATVSNLVVSGRTTKLSNMDMDYRWKWINGTDVNWKTVANISAGTSPYAGVSFQVDVLNAAGNHGQTSSMVPLRYFVSAIRSTGTLDTPDSGTVSGPIAEYVRLVKTATGFYELQVRAPINYTTIEYSVRVISTAGATTTYVDNPVDGSTTGTAYTANTNGYTQHFAALNVNGVFNMGHTTVLTAGRALQNVSSASIQGNVTAGGSISSSSTITGTQLISTASTGTAPLTVASTTKVLNLNADLLDGMDSAAFGQLAANNTWSGNNLLQASTDSSNMFSIQSSSAASLFNVDSTGAGNVTILGATSGAAGVWQTASSSMPAQRYMCATVAANGYLYCIGGGTGYTVGHSTVYYAKINSNGDLGPWASTTSLPAARYGAGGSTVVANGYVYIVGGVVGGTQTDTTIYARINSDGTLGTWKSASSLLPQARGSSTTVLIGGYLYSFGGGGASGSQSEVYFSKLSSDGTIGVWQQATNSLPAVRNIAAGVYANGYMYFMGGYDGTAPADTVYYAKITPDGTAGSVGTWSSGPSLPVATSNAMAGVVNGTIYFVAGNGSSGAFDTVYHARINTDASLSPWQLSPNHLPYDAHSVGRAVVNGYFYAVGGGGSGGAVATTVYTRLGGTLQIGGSLDLVGLQGQNLTEAGGVSAGSMGGSITAGDIMAVGSLQVQGQTLLSGSTSIVGDFSAANGLFSVGASDGGTVIVLNGNGETSSWKTSTNGLPSPRATPITAVANGYVYAVGGYDGTTSQNTTYYAKLNADGSVNSWQTSPNLLPSGRDTTRGIVANGYLYVIGGKNGITFQSTVYYTKLNADGSIGPWQTGTAMATGARANAGMAVANGYVYMVGGTNGTAQSSTVYAKLNADGSLGAWQTAVNTLPAARNVLTSVVANGYIYALGGNDGTATSQTSVYYAKLNADGSLGAWQTAVNTLPAGRQSHTSVVSNGYVYVMGGSNGGFNQTTVYFASLNADGSVGSWQTSANSLPYALSQASSVIANGYTYQIGGMSSIYQQYLVHYSRFGGALKIGGSLDLVGLQGQNLADSGDPITGTTGGSITAGNITAVGSLQVQRQATFTDNANVMGDFVAGNGLFSTSVGLSQVSIGNAVADAVGVVLVLDTKNTTGDPTGTNGAMYYNSALARFRCYENGAWLNCGGGNRTNVSTTTQAIPTTDTLLNGSTINLPSGGLNGPTGISQNGTLLRWRIKVLKTGGTAAVTFTIRFGTAGTAADTARCTAFGTGTGTAVGDIADITITAYATAGGSGTTLNCTATMTHALATTGWNTTAYAISANSTQAAFDTTVANTKATLSFSTPTTGATTGNVILVESAATNL